MEVLRKYFTEIFVLKSGFSEKGVGRHINSDINYPKLFHYPLPPLQKKKKIDITLAPDSVLYCSYHTASEMAHNFQVRHQLRMIFLQMGYNLDLYQTH